MILLANHSQHDTMNCFKPKRIKNKYTDDWLFVPCRQCDACRINSANSKAIAIAEEMSKYKYMYFIRLGYDNDSVPYVIQGMNGIFRNAEYIHVQKDYVWKKSEFPIRIEDCDVSKVDFNKCHSLNNHAVKNSVGVLYYNDFKNFIKRLRKLYGKEDIKFSYVIGIEYGSRTQRPHGHIAIMSNDIRFKESDIKSAIVKCWPMQNWYVPGYGFNEELCKRCDAKTAYYIASYINGNICNNGVSKIKRFRPKVCRSKGLDFGIAEQSIKKIKDFIFGRYDNELSRIGNKVFEIVDTTKLDRISYKPVPMRYFCAFFPRFKGYGKTSPGSFKTCARRIYSMFNYGNRKELMENDILSSLDIEFMRGFRRYKGILFPKLDINKNGSFSTIVYDDEKLFESYLNTHEVASKLYNSLCLEYEMKDYERVGKVNYFLSKINTYAEDLEKRIIKISRYCGSPQSTVDVNCPPLLRSALKNKCNKYYYRLLPKHFNQLIFDFS